MQKRDLVRKMLAILASLIIHFICLANGGQAKQDSAEERLHVFFAWATAVESNSEVIGHSFTSSRLPGTPIDEKRSKEYLFRANRKQGMFRLDIREYSILGPKYLGHEAVFTPTFRGSAMETTEGPKNNWVFFVDEESPRLRVPQIGTTALLPLMNFGSTVSIGPDGRLGPRFAKNIAESIVIKDEVHDSGEATLIMLYRSRFSGLKIQFMSEPKFGIKEVQVYRDKNERPVEPNEEGLKAMQNWTLIGKTETSWKKQDKDYFPFRVYSCLENPDEERMFYEMETIFMRWTLNKVDERLFQRERFNQEHFEKDNPFDEWITLYERDFAKLSK